MTKQGDVITSAVTGLRYEVYGVLADRFVCYRLADDGRPTGSLVHLAKRDVVKTNDQADDARIKG